MLPRHCEPTGRANARPMTGSAKQSIRHGSENGLLRRFAPRNDVLRSSRKIGKAKRAHRQHQPLIDVRWWARRDERAFAYPTREPADSGTGTSNVFRVTDTRQYSPTR